MGADRCDCLACACRISGHRITSRIIMVVCVGDASSLEHRRRHGAQGEGPTCSAASALRLLGVLLRLRLLAFFARRLVAGCRLERVEPRLQQRGPRFSDAQGAIAVDALLRVIAAEFVALARRSPSGRAPGRPPPGCRWRGPRSHAQALPIAFSAMARSFTILAASLTSDAPSGPQRPPGMVWQSAALKTQVVIWDGTRTAPSRTSNATGQAGTFASKRSRPSGRPTFVASIDFSPTMSMTQRCEESDTLSPASCSLSTVAVVSSPEICSSPDLPLSMSGRPARLAIPATRPGLTPLAPAPACDAAAAELLCFAGATLAPWGSAGAAPGSINCARVSLAARAARKSPQIRGRKPRLIGEV